MSDPMRLELASPGRTVAENIELALLGERCGWGGVWLAETTGLDALAGAGAVAARLASGRVGTAIVPMQTRGPMLLAMAAASIAPLAPGGFVLGLGTSTPLIVEDWHATPWGASPLALARECVALTRRFLQGERVTTESGRWRYRRAQLARPPPQRTPPIYLAALNDKMLELAGEIADGVVLNFVTVADVYHARERVAAGAARAGRSLDDFELVVFFRATVTADYQLVRARYQRELLTYIMAPVYERMFSRESPQQGSASGHPAPGKGWRDACREVQALWRARERQQALDAVPDGLIRERTLIGEADEVRERLAEYAAAGMDSAVANPVALPEAEHLADTARIIRALGN